VIDKSGKWWKGQTFDDLVEYLRLYTQDGYPVARVEQSVCTCGGRAFRLHADPDEGGVRRTCVACKAKTFVADSEDYWEDAAPKLVRCPCGKSENEVGVGFSLRAGGEVRWITVGNRCIACGTLAACADWGVDYAPTDHLFNMA
jgi:hypothetical protein